MIRSRRAGQSRDQDHHQPLYARVLGLKHLTPSGFLCFVFLEGAIVLGILLALAELVSWWGVLVLPLTVAAMVKLNDMIAGVVSPPPAVPARRVVSSASAGRASSVPGTGREPFAARSWIDVPQASGVNETVGGPALRSAVAPLLAPEGGWSPRVGDGVPLVGSEGWSPRVGDGVPLVGSEGWSPRVGDDVPLARAGMVNLRRPEPNGWPSEPAATAVDANGPTSPASGPWAEELDARLQRERQSAARRYESGRDRAGT